MRYFDTLPQLKQSAGEALFAQQLKAYGINMDAEVRFHPTRRWRFDYAKSDKFLAVEIEGGTYINGRHNRGATYEKDCEKYNAAAELGWRVFRYTTGMVKQGEAIKQIKRVLDVMA